MGMAMGTVLGMVMGISLGIVLGMVMGIILGMAMLVPEGVDNISVVSSVAGSTDNVSKPIIAIVWAMGMGMGWG